MPACLGRAPGFGVAPLCLASGEVCACAYPSSGSPPVRHTVGSDKPHGASVRVAVRERLRHGDLSQHSRDGALGVCIFAIVNLLNSSN